jgi:hypothetical protein
LPCSACLAGKLRKNRGQPDKNYTDIENLNNTLVNLPLSWTASTADKNVTPNRTVSIDWGIINKKTQSGKNNVFALFLDINTGITFIFPAESRGQAGVALQAYIQTYGKPNEVIHDNATEFIQGEFAQICLDHHITQTRSPPYEPNKKSSRALHGHHRIHGAIALIHLGPRPRRFLGLCTRTRSTNTESYSSTWSRNSV